MNRLCILTLLLLYPVFIQSQTKEQRLDYFDIAKSFDRSAYKKSGINSKEQEWLNHWLNFYASRVNTNGSLPNESIIWEEYLKLNSVTKQSPQVLPQAAWAFVGPDYVPPSPYQYASHGIGRINCVAFHPSDSNIFWIGSGQGGVWKTTDGGITWNPLTDQLPITRISDIAVDPLHPDTMYISVGDYAYIGIGLMTDGRKRNTHYGMGVFKTTNGGITWSPTTLSFNLTDFDGSLIRRVLINPNNTSSLVAAGTSGIWKSADGGQNWLHINDSLIWDLEMDPTSPNILYASSGFVANLQLGSAAIMKSVDFGTTWTVLNTGIPPKNAAQRIELTISRKDHNYIYAVACDGSPSVTGSALGNGLYGFYKSIDGGTNWTLMADTLSAPNILAYGDGVNPDRTGGQGTYDLAIVADAFDKDRVYVGGINVWGTDDGGITWDGVSFWWPKFASPAVHADQHFLAFNPLNKRYYVCNDGGIYSTDSVIIGSWVSANLSPSTYSWPTNWTNHSNGLGITSFYRLGIGPNVGSKNYIVAGAHDNSTFFYNGTAWTNIFGGDGMEAIIEPSNPSQTVYGSYQYGVLLFTNNAGASYNGYDFNWVDAPEWTAPFISDPNNPGTYYVAAGDIWETTTGINTSTNWQSISNFTPLLQTSFPIPTSAMAIAPGNSNYIYVAKRVMNHLSVPGEMWVTTNGGTTWQDITLGLPDSLYFTYVAVSNTNPNVAWVTCGGFTSGVKIFKTINGGASWTNISYNLPNVPANCVVHHKNSSDNTIYVGTDLGVFYLNDNITSWQPLGTNLPNVIVTELEIQYNDQKIYATTFGRGIWKTDVLAISVNELNDKIYSDDIRVYPNPNNGRFTVKIENTEGRSFTIEITDITGRVLLRDNEIEAVGTIHKNIEYPFSAGFYFIKVVQDNGSIKTKPFVIAR